MDLILDPARIGNSPWLYTMMKKLLFIFLVYHPVLASEAVVYTLGDNLKAVFSCSPQFTVVQAGVTGYYCTDEESLITYTVGIVPVGKIEDSEIESHLNAFIEGDEKALDGKTTYKSMGMIGSNRGAYFIIKFRYQGYPGTKYAAVIYGNDHFYQWAIQDIQGLSKVDGVSIFNKYIQYFSVE